MTVTVTVTRLLSFALVFAAVHWVATLNVGSGGAHASYYHRANEQVRPPTQPPPGSAAPTCCSSRARTPTLSFHAADAGWDPSTQTDASLILAHDPQVQVGVEFEANTRLQDTAFSFGYHLTLPQANMVFRGEGS